MFWLKKKTKAQKRRFIVEQLESRSVLSSFALGGMDHIHSHDREHFASAAIPNAATYSPAPTAAVTSSVFKSVQSSAATTQPESHLSATLSSSVSGSTASGMVSFNSETEHGKTQMSFKVNVQGATASTTLDVLVGTTKVGVISTDASGNGSLVLSSKPHGSALSFPADFPSIAAGDSVSVGSDLTGTLAASTSSGENEHEHEGGEGDSGESEGSETKLATTLTDPTGATTATGKASYHSEQEDGASVTTFKASVKGATAGATLPVTIDGANVGTITVDANGNGSLYLSSNTNKSKASPLPADFPTVNNDSIVMIGDTLTGTLGTIQHNAKHHRH